ncbi:MAG: uracil-DNA glycosylase [Desulfobacterales bacterium]|nr:uracil-DNA glycosylase [Desulfobacterales bacterium]
MTVEIGPNREDLNTVVTEIGHTLRFMARSGCRGFDPSPQCLAAIAAWGNPSAGSGETLAEIRTDLGDCRRCGLAAGRSHIVFGSGHPQARLVFVGEGPGHEEDQQGEPFVGAAGQLLTKIIQAMKLSRKDVYICNIVKCRPPGNRNPAPDEIAACSPFLERQIAAIKPKLICALGTFAAQTLLATNIPISKLRGSFYPYRGVRVLPTYHPAFLLRNPERKRDVWEDVQKLMRELEGTGD